MYYKFQKLKSGSSKHWEDMNDGSYKTNDVETIFQMWEEIISYTKDDRLFVWDFGKDNSLLFSIDDKTITVWLYEKGGKIIPLGEKKIEGVDVLDFLKQLKNWQSIFDIVKLLNN